jgi:hypothetical protein
MVGGILAACGSTEADAGTALNLADVDSMPLEVQNAPNRVAEAYRFAAANRAVLKKIPCYCGCGPMGHDSNYACFWQDEAVVETHAMDCGLCVDIAQDTMSGLRQGRSLSDIRDQIDADYARFGPSTDTPPVELPQES